MVSGTTEGPSAATGQAPAAPQEHRLHETRPQERPPHDSPPFDPPVTATGCEPRPPVPGARAHSPADVRADAFRRAPMALAVLDRAGRVVEANDAFAALLGTGPGAGALSRVAAELLGRPGDETVRAVLEGRRAGLRRTRRVRDAEGRARWLLVAVEPPRADGPGGALLSVTDISARRELEARVRDLRMHDPVTRLPNRALFFERLASVAGPSGPEGAAEHGEHPEDRWPPEAGQARTGRIGVCYLDLDGFKAVNDTFGHRTGDLLLTAVAERLSRVAVAGARGGRTPLVARLGGDEFALLVPDSSGTEQLTALAAAALVALEEPFDADGERLSVSASVGVVERPASATTATELMQDADTTLYWAKADGGGRWTLFDPERNAHRMTRQVLAAELRPAIGRGEFVLDYQPLVDLADGTTSGVEALVRWRHPQFGTLPPSRFIGQAEEDGSVVQLGRWVLRTACAQARAWQVARPGRRAIFVSVNVAVRQVWDSDLVADVAAALEATGLPPELLQLELTESALMGSAGRPLRVLQALSAMGVRIAIDDFGTGYSNLSYLSRLPVSVLKLDGSFVRSFRDDVPPGAADEVVVEAMVSLAHRLGLTVTAECVETAQQARRLRGIGCDTGQGWLWSRPVGPERIAGLLRQQG
ncbi:histidine kinase [Streptomyces albidoflavus]|nr:histidine kinase [Streptomyces albidoflavus]RZE05771.1 histidine kinase [Streptomyces albidoflavus]